MTTTAHDSDPVPGLAPFDPVSPEVFADPYPVFARYRQADPIHFGRAADPRLPGAWYLFRYQDNAQLFQLSAERPPHFGGLEHKAGIDLTSAAAQTSTLRTLTDGFLGRKDAPEHTRVRRVMNRTFTPKRVASYRPSVEAAVDEFIDDLLSRGEPFNLVTDLAFPLPIVVIARLLGVDPADREWFKQWSRGFLGAADLDGTLDNLRVGEQAAQGFVGYFERLIEQRRPDPRDDMLSLMLSTEDEPDGMTHDEIVSMSTGLVVGGHETTLNLIGLGLLGLLQQRDQYELLSEQAATIGAPAVEELLRWVSPAQRSGPRYVYDEVTIGGKVFHRGEYIQPMIAAANHDPEQFTDPGRIDLRRDPNRHLAFGGGIHFCLGSPLARLEAEVVFTRLAARAPQLRLVDGRRPVFRPNFLVRGLTDLWVEA